MDLDFEEIPTGVCPACGKRFVPAPEHAYKVMIRRKPRLVCSWSCILLWERSGKVRGRGVWNKRPVMMYDANGTLVGSYKSIVDCAEDHDLNPCQIGRAARGEIRNHKGYVFRYAD